MQPDEEELDVAVADIKVGDRLYRCHHQGSMGSKWTPGSHVVPDEDSGYDSGTAGYGRKYLLKRYSQMYFIVWRKKDQGFTISKGQWGVNLPYQAQPKRIKEWPHDCPRCNRREAAYLGLNQYECRYGCYGPVRNHTTR